MIPERALIIEVIDADAQVWTAMATEHGGIMRELASAPPAAAITIYEWRLAKGRGFPEWRYVETYPWASNRGT